MDAQILEFNRLKESELGKVQLDDSLKQKVLTPFYLYLKDKVKQRQNAYPKMTYLEIIAMIQEDWS